MDERCCEYLQGELGVHTIRSDEPAALLQTLARPQVISLWHSLEHLREPAELLAAAAERLEPGGVLALGVPNPRSLQFRLLGARWAHLDAPRHICPGARAGACRTRSDSWSAVSWTHHERPIRAALQPQRVGIRAASSSSRQAHAHAGGAGRWAACEARGAGGANRPPGSGAHPAARQGPRDLVSRFGTPDRSRKATPEDAVLRCVWRRRSDDDDLIRKPLRG